jgi:hypothetical protein
MDGRFGIRPGRTHCMLLGPPLIGALGAENGSRSGGGYIGGGRGAIGVRSAFGPVGILAGRDFGDVFMEGAPALRGPNAAMLAVIVASCGAYGGNGALENCGDALGRKAACGAIGGGRGFGAGPCGEDLAGTDKEAGADGADGADGATGTGGVGGTDGATD